MNNIQRALATLFVMSLLASCGGTEHLQKVAVLVEIDRPENISDQTIAATSNRSTLRFDNVDGLERKYFTHSNSTVGGVYLWSSHEEAKQFFSAKWESTVHEKYGSKPRLTWLKTPVITEGGDPGSASDNAIVAVVSVRAPWYAPAAMIRSRMENAVPDYQSIVGLDFKYFTMGSDRRVGGIYLWKSIDNADAFYDEAWQRRIQEIYGEAAQLDYYKSALQITPENQID